MKLRYFAKEFCPGRWNVCDRNNHDLPLYDDVPDGEDKPLIFKDNDRVLEFVRKINLENEKEIENN